MNPPQMVILARDLARCKSTLYLCHSWFHVSLTVLSNDSFVSVAHCVNAAMEPVGYIRTEMR